MLGVTGRSPRVRSVSSSSLSPSTLPSLSLSRKGSPEPPVPVSLLDDSFLNDTFVSTIADPTTGSTGECESSHSCVVLLILVPLVYNPSMSTASSSSGANGDDREEENEEFIREECVSNSSLSSVTSSPSLQGIRGAD